MNHRQRVLTALRHQEPDRVPIDLGGTVDSTIMAGPPHMARDVLGLSAGRPRGGHVYPHTALVGEGAGPGPGGDARVVFCGTPTVLARRLSPTSS